MILGITCEQRQDAQCSSMTAHEGPPRRLLNQVCLEYRVPGASARNVPRRHKDRDDG